MIENCLHCGSTAILKHDANRSYVQCNNCGIRTDFVCASVYYCADDEAIALWNSKAEVGKVRNIILYRLMQLRKERDKYVTKEAMPLRAEIKARISEMELLLENFEEGNDERPLG